jgi:hypothetical protein
MPTNAPPFDLTAPRDYSRTDSVVEWVVRGPNNEWFQIGQSTLGNLIRVAKTRANAQQMARRDWCPGNVCPDWMVWLMNATQMTDPTTQKWEYIPDADLPPSRTTAWDQKLLRMLVYLAFEKPRGTSWAQVAVPANVTYPAWGVRTDNNPQTPTAPATYTQVPAVVAQKSGGGTVTVEKGSNAQDLSKPVEPESILPKLLLLGAAGAAVYWFFIRKAGEQKAIGQKHG